MNNSNEQNKKAKTLFYLMAPHLKNSLEYF